MSDRTNLIVEPAASVFDSVLEAHRADGFNAGYHRAVNDMLADFALVAI